VMEVKSWLRHRLVWRMNATPVLVVTGMASTRSSRHSAVVRILHERGVLEVGVPPPDHDSPAEGGGVPEQRRPHQRRSRIARRAELGGLGAVLRDYQEFRARRAGWQIRPWPL
jgi:hypothetical protein